MEPRPRNAGKSSSTLQDRVAQLYYSHGLFCSSYPISVISIAITIALLCCYPLVHLPLSGNLAMRTWTTSNWNNSVFHASAEVDGEELAGLNVDHNDPPWCYIQQVVLRSAVIPWPGSEMQLGDAFRAPLYEAFKLLDIVRNYEDNVTLKSLGHVCLHVEAIKKPKGRNNILPEYSCLVLSPANLWRQDVQLFAQDASILNTVFNHQSLQKGKTSLSEILFGMHLSDTGIKRYPLRNRQRIIQYAITIFLKDYDEPFTSGLRRKLYTLYPLHQDANRSDIAPKPNDTVLIHYPGDINYYEFIPLIITYILLFLYYYFSVRKIEMIKSKFGMAFTVLCTVLCSLAMTIGVCFFFGVTLTFHGKEVFPYLVILVGLENVLVLTKSVVSTPTHLDVKIRVAQGLSREGWSITKNLLIEITIMTIGIFTFVPAIQEFCIFAIVSLINDYFLQMLFFSTVLGIDTRRTVDLNVDDKNSHPPNYRQLYHTHHFQEQRSVGISRSKSQPRLHNGTASHTHTDVVAGQAKSSALPAEKKIPKRLRLVNIWARTRFFQRSFMILTVVWISIILYNSGLVEQIVELTSGQFNQETKYDKKIPSRFDMLPVLNSDQNYMVNYVTQKTPEQSPSSNFSDELARLKHPEFNVPWMKLSTQHWPAVLGKYNVSLSGRTVAVLPTIQLSQSIAPEQAKLLRNADEKYGDKFHWKALAAALDPIDFTDLEVDNHNGRSAAGSAGAKLHQSERPFYPTSPMEIALVSILCVISIGVLAYAVVVLYKCICSRHYAEWRASWFSRATNNSGDSSDAEEPVHFEAVPVILDGHQQDIECLATDGFNIISSCLGGQLRIWDSNTGERVGNIERNTFFADLSKKSISAHSLNADQQYDNIGYPMSRDDLHLQMSPKNAFSFPSLKHRIHTNFKNAHVNSSDPANSKNKSKLDFDKTYRQLYEPVQRSPRMQFSVGSPGIDYRESGSRRTSASAGNRLNRVIVPPAIWCIDSVDNLIVLGCANGRLEFWEGTTSKFKCLVEDENAVGITSVKIVGSQVLAARLSGVLEFLKLQTYNQGRPIDWNFSSAYRRTHIRTGSAGSIKDIRANQSDYLTEEDMRCIKVVSTRAHQQPITCLDCEGGNVVTGSTDHTLKVYRLDDCSAKYTLHGHCGPITSLFIDRISPATSGSGSQDGMLCVWDLLSGACMYSVQAHDGPVTSLTYSASYVISLGADERICVWERFQGHLLNAIQHQQLPPATAGGSQLVMLTPHLLVTVRCGGLVVWDVRTGDSVRTIVLGQTPYVFVRQLVMLRDAVLCDYGRQLRIVRFPRITHKYD